jgi:tol-pal system protein YbgF
MKKIGLALLLLASVTTVAIAEEIPIEDLSVNSQSQDVSQSASPSSQPEAAQLLAPQHLSTEQRLSKLEQQMVALHDATSNLNAMQEQIQNLQGEVDTQKHELMQLRKQLNDYYKDLDSRISGSTTTAPAVSSDTATSLATTSTTNTSKETKATPVAAASAVPATTVAAKNVDGKELYQSALSLLKDKKYAEAAKKLQLYISKYPNDIYAPNAHFWLGDIYYLWTNTTKAEHEFNVVVVKYPNSEKVPDAMLKLATIYSDRGEYNKASQEFKKIAAQYPNSSAAQMMGQIQKATEKGNNTTKKKKVATIAD